MEKLDSLSRVFLPTAGEWFADVGVTAGQPAANLDSGVEAVVTLSVETLAFFYNCIMVIMINQSLSLCIIKEQNATNAAL